MQKNKPQLQSSLLMWAMTKKNSFFFHCAVKWVFSFNAVFVQCWKFFTSYIISFFPNFKWYLLSCHSISIRFCAKWWKTNFFPNYFAGDLKFVTKNWIYIMLNQSTCPVHRNHTVGNWRHRRGKNLVGKAGNSARACFLGSLCNVLRARSAGKGHHQNNTSAICRYNCKLQQKYAF